MKLQLSAFVPEKEVARFETLVKPGRKLSKAIVDLTGITDGELTNAPEPQDALQQFIDFLKDDIIVAHNANFDVNFLYDSMQRCGMNPLENNFVDTMRLAKCIRPDPSNYKLATLAKAYRIAQPKAHRALADCERPRWPFFKSWMKMQGSRKSTFTRSRKRDILPVPEWPVLWPNPVKNARKVLSMENTAFSPTSLIL